MKTTEQWQAIYPDATDDQVMDGCDNALTLMQDKYGYEVVTDKFLMANEKEFNELVEASIESYFE